MSAIPKSSTVVLAIDMQQGIAVGHSDYFGKERSNPSFEHNTRTLYNATRASGIQIVHIKHDSLDPDCPLHPDDARNAFIDYAVPMRLADLPVAPQTKEAPTPEATEVVLLKNVNSAFIGTSLESLLRKLSTRRLVIFGLTTDHCVSTTTRMAANLGVVDRDGSKGEILLIGDATAAHGKGGFDAETVQKVNLASLNDEFCKVVTTAQVLEEMKKWQ